jgi:hypothetical protein
VKVRFPVWATSGMTVAVNGAAQAVGGKPGSYVTVDREWKTGDTLAIRLPMTLRTEAMPDNPKVVAVFYGPILLAGDLGREGLTPAIRYGPSAPPVRRMAMPPVPGLVGDARTLLSAIRPVAGSPLTFRMPVAHSATNHSGSDFQAGSDFRGTGVEITPGVITLIPFYRASDIRYAAYWNVYSPDEWDAQVKDRAAAEARQRSLPARTVDAVDLGLPESEKAHDYQQQGAAQADFDGRMGREAGRDAWFSYALTVRPDTPLALAVACRGGEGRRRVFDILVDGEKIVTETVPYHPTELLDMEYPIPDALTRGKTRIVVKFQPQDQAATAQVFEIRVVARTK